MNHKENYIGNLNEAAKIHDYSARINGVEIPLQNMPDLQINFGKRCEGTLTFFDNSGISELAPLTYSLLEISYSDVTDFMYNGAFMITKVETTRFKDGMIKQKLFFEHLSIYLLKNIYISKTFVNKTILEMLGEIFLERKIPGLINLEKEELAKPKRYDYFVFPKNISLWEFMEKHLKYEDVYFYFSKLGLRLIPRSLLAPKYLEEEKNEYIFSSDVNKSYFSILEFRGNTSNLGELTKIPSIKRNKFDIENLQYNPEIIDIENLMNTEAVNQYIGMRDQKFEDMFFSVGFKEIDVLNSVKLFGKDEELRDVLRSNQSFEIAVQGLNVDRMFKIVTINFPRAKYMDAAPFDEVFSGKYIVTETIDRIISGAYFQILKLETPDYNKGSMNVWK